MKCMHKPPKVTKTGQNHRRSLRAKPEFLPVRCVWLNWTQKGVGGRGRGVASALDCVLRGSAKTSCGKKETVRNGGLLRNFFTVLEKNRVLCLPVTTDNSSEGSDLWESEVKTPCSLLVCFLASFPLPCSLCGGSINSFPYLSFSFPCFFLLNVGHAV